MQLMDDRVGKVTIDLMDDRGVGKVSIHLMDIECGR